MTPVPHLRPLDDSSACWSRCGQNCIAIARAWSARSIDGEDVLQDALIKAVEAVPPPARFSNPEGWLFRIAHNTALDFLRRRSRQESAPIG